MSNTPIHEPVNLASGKYFHVNVPDFTKDAEEKLGDKRDAYLRVGDVGALADTVTAKYLVDQFTGFAADAGIDWHERDASGEGVDRKVKYDPNGQFEKLALTTEEQRAELRRKALVEGAGWRDHCDGNRITTTTGDKVEVVGGNYQLIVLGRGSSAGEGSFDDHSGGNHIDGTVSPPQTVTKTTFTSSFDGGQWSFVEESRKASVHEIFTGEHREDFCGPRRTSIVGMLTEPVRLELVADGVLGGGLRGATGLKAIPPTEPDGLAPAAADASPDILEITLATAITEYVGAKTSPVGSITSKTWATKITEDTTASGAYSETLFVGGNLSTSTTAGLALTETTTVTGAATSTTTIGGALTETVTVGGALTTSTTFNTAWDYNQGNAAFESTQIWARLTMENIGADVSLSTIIAEAALRVCPDEVLIQMGMHNELFLGVHREVTIGQRWEVVVGQEYEHNIAKNDVTIFEKKSFLMYLIG
jgi:hypothetical protein